MVLGSDSVRGSTDPPSAFEPVRQSKISPETSASSRVRSLIRQKRDESSAFEPLTISTKDPEERDAAPVLRDEPTLSPVVENPVVPNDPMANWTSGFTSWFTWMGPTAASTKATEESKEKSALDVDDESVTAHSTTLFKDLPDVPSVMGDSTRAGTVGGATIGTIDIDGDAQTVTTQLRDQNVAAIIEKKVGNMERLPKIDEVSNENRRNHLVKELKTTIATFGRYDIRVANISAALGDLLGEINDVEGCLKLHREAVSIFSAKFGDHHKSTIEAKMQLAHHLEESKQLDEATAIYFNVCQMQKALHGDKATVVADTLTRLASALRKQDDYNQAVKELKRALKIYRDALGDSDVKVSKTVDEIASLYVSLGDFEKSAAILEEVVKLRVATMGMKSKGVAETLVDLATTHECNEDFTNALKALKKAYKIFADLGGYSTEDSVSTLNRIAQIYDAIGDNDRAAIAYLGVLRGRKILSGSESLSVAETYYRLGQSLRKTDQSEKALKCMKEALPIYVSKGVDLSDVEMIAEIMHEMALIHKENKKFNEANRILKQELDVRQKIGQDEYPYIARTLNHLGVVEYELKNTSKALKYLVDALAIFQKQGEQGVDCAEVLFNSGLVFEVSKNYERASDAYEEAARIFRANKYSQDHPHVKKVNGKITKMQKILKSHNLR